MPLPIKYAFSATSYDNAVRLGNIALGVNAIDYGPSTTTGWTNSVPASDGGYAIYYFSGTNIRMRTAVNDSTLITVAGQIMGTTYTSVSGSLMGLTGGGFTPVSVNPPNLVTSGSVLNLNASLVMSYPRGGTTWYDINGTNTTNNGTLTNGPTFNSTSNSIVFDGTNDYINWTTDILSSLTSISYDVWVKFSSLQNAFLISCTTFKVYHQNNSVWYIAGITGNQNISWTFNNGWVHFSYSFDGVNHLCYINGVPYTVNAGGGLSCQSNLQIGGRNSGNLPLNGNIASTKIYNRALSQSEILQNYYQGNIVTSSLTMALDAGNLVSYPGSGTAWTTLTGSNSSTLANGPTFSSANGGVIVFDGVDDTATTTLTNTGTNNTTQIVWYKWNGINQIKGISYLGNGGSTGFGFLIHDGSGGTAGNKVGVLYGGVAYNALSGGASATLTSGVWCQLAITRDSTTTSLYQNGTLIGTTTSTPAGNTSSLAFVANSSAGGSISSVLFYNKALSQTEIQQNFNAHKNRFNL